MSLILLMLIWVTLSRSTDPHVLWVGFLAAAAVLLIQRQLFSAVPLFSISFLCRPFQLVFFLYTLTVRFVTSTIHTCRLIILGQEEGSIVAVPVKLKDSLAQFILLNSITLTPSTISLLLEENLLYIHWLRKKGSAGDWQQTTRSLELRIKSAFEDRDNVDS